MARPMDELLNELESELQWAISRVDNKPHQIESSLRRMERLLREAQEHRVGGER